MRQAGKIVATVLMELRERVKPGTTLIELDHIADRIIREHEAVPSFKGKQHTEPDAPPFPASICTSVNDEIVHGIPSSRRLKEGEILKLDAGAYYKGYHADSAVTIPVGNVSKEANELIRVTQECLTAAIAATRSGNRTGDIGAAIQQTAESQGFSDLERHSSFDRQWRAANC